MSVSSVFVLHALFAADVELDTVAQNLAGDVRPKRAHYALDGGRSEFAYIPAPDTYGVMVMLEPRQAVLGRAVWEGQFADNARLDEQLDRPVDRRSSDARQLFMHLFGAKSFELFAQVIDHSAPWRR